MSRNNGEQQWRGQIEEWEGRVPYWLRIYRETNRNMLVEGPAGLHWVALSCKSVRPQAHCAPSLTSSLCSSAVAAQQRLHRWPHAVQPDALAGGQQVRAIFVLLLVVGVQAC